MKLLVRISLVLVLIFANSTAYGRVFSLFYFPSLTFEHGGQSIGSEFYLQDKYSLGMTWARNSKNTGSFEMKQRFVTSDVSVWTGEDSQWNRWRFGMGLGYHWLHPEYESGTEQYFGKKVTRASLGVSVGWRAILFNTLFLEPSISPLFYNRCVKHLDYCFSISGFVGLKIGAQI